MSTLAETQSWVRSAVIEDDADAATSLSPLLVGGRDPEKRLSVHRRNYRKSLVDALLIKFPATGWLMGSPLVIQAAERFVREHPPAAPCIAEYGVEFPKFLAQDPGSERAPYLADFAELEWFVGQVAIAVDRPPVLAQEFSDIDSNELPDTFLTLQPGLRFFQVGWPVDELMTLYLTETAPERLELSPTNVCLEVRGARGEFHLTRLDPAEFVFCKSVADRHSIGDAAEFALQVSTGFDPGHALTELIGRGLITSLAAGYR